MSATTAAKPLHEEYSLRAPREYRNYIDGEWVASATGKTFENRNPANEDDLVGTFQNSNAHDVSAAVDAADRAFAKWRLTPAPKRAEFLYHVGEILRRDKEKIARDMTREMGKVLEETRATSRKHRHGLLHGRRGPAPVRRTTRPSCLTSSPWPCACRWACAGMITPWNFPMAIPSWKIDARADLRQHRGHQAGHDHAAVRAHAGGRISKRPELPHGVFNMVTGSGRGGRAIR